MALFTDGNIATLEDLRAYESGILDLAATQGVDLAAKLTLAQRELSLDVTSFLLKRGVAVGAQRQLTNVVVTEPMLHAHVMGTLSLIYRDVYNSQLNDRFEGKWKQYTTLAREAVSRLFEIGVGIVNAPVSKSSVPMVSTVVGGMRPATTWLVRTAAVNWQGFAGAQSDTVVVEVRPGELLRVDPGVLPEGGTGWVISAGDSEGRLFRQTTTPLAAGSIWTSSREGLREDLPAVVAQTPDQYVINRRELLRG